MVLAGRAIYGDEHPGLRKLMEQGAPVADKPGQVRHVDIFAPYRDRIVGDIKLARPLKIVVDRATAVAGASRPDIFRAIGLRGASSCSARWTAISPNHHPDPSKLENLRDLIAKLKETGADLGLAFDGDGDRLGIITREGNNIFPDRQMMLFARTCCRACRRAHPVRRQVHAAAWRPPSASRRRRP
jgi:phosphomannomutase